MNKLGLSGRKWEIFTSAVSLYSKNGYSNVSMRDIANVNKIKAPSIYKHFQSKEEILTTIYVFYDVNSCENFPILEKILEATDKEPTELLFMTISYYDNALQLLMDQMHVILITQAVNDPAAYELIKKVLFGYGERLIGALLERLIKEERISPVDKDAFLSLYLNYTFSAAFRNGTDAPVPPDLWTRSLNLLFSLIK